MQIIRVLIMIALAVSISTNNVFAMHRMLANKKSHSPKGHNGNLVRALYRKQVMKYHLGQLVGWGIAISSEVQRQILDTIVEKEYESFSSGDLQALAQDMHQLTLSATTNELSLETFFTALEMVRGERADAHERRYGSSQVATPPASLSTQQWQRHSSLTPREIGQLIPILGRIPYSEELFEDNPLFKEDLSEEEIFWAASRLVQFMQWYRNDEMSLADRNELCEGIIARYRGKSLTKIFRKYLELSTEN